MFARRRVESSPSDVYDDPLARINDQIIPCILKGLYSISVARMSVNWTNSVWCSTPTARMQASGQESGYFTLQR